MSPRSVRWVRAATLVAVAFSGGALAARLSFATSRAESPYASMAELARVLVLAENDYVDPVDHAKMVQGAIRGMVHELDPHSAYMAADEFRMFQNDTEGRFGGVGIEVDTRDDAITVIAPIEGSPGHRAGIRPGDRIVSVDGQPLRGEPLDKLVQKLRGTPGTHVRLGIRRRGHDAPLVFDLVREQIHVTSVVAKRLAGNVLYVRIKQFQEGTHHELLAALGELRSASKSDPAGLLLDLRNNPGGLVDEASAVADEFLTRGVIYSTRHRGRITEEVHAHSGGAAIGGRIAVLVNEYSASAAELLAGALQDNGRASVVGTATFGKGSVQTILELPDGAGLKLTTMRYYTPSGRSLQAAGVRPDVLLEPPPLVDGEDREIVRERDLSGHLVEEREVQPPREPELRLRQPRPESAPADTPLRPPSTGADVPDDPTVSNDFALSVAYRVARGTLPGVRR